MSSPIISGFSWVCFLLFSLGGDEWIMQRSVWLQWMLSLSLSSLSLTVIIIIPIRKIRGMVSEWHGEKVEKRLLPGHRGSEHKRCFCFLWWKEGPWRSDAWTDRKKKSWSYSIKYPIVEYFYEFFFFWNWNRILKCRLNECVGQYVSIGMVLQKSTKVNESNCSYYTPHFQATKSLHFHE